MSVLLIAEHNNSDLSEATVKAATAALELGGDVHVLVAGSGCASVADAASKIAGISKVVLADAPAFDKMLAEPVAALVVSLAGSYDAIVTAATTNGKNFSPRIAALLDCSQVSDVSKVIDANTFERPIYAGNAIQTVSTSESKKVLTIRTTAFKAAELTGSAAIEAATIGDLPALSEFVGEELTKSDRPELTAAKVIVSGGRGMQSVKTLRCLKKLQTS